jgi:NADH-quinone oxidoreductase subunit E
MSPLELPGARDPYMVLDGDEVARIQALRKRYPSGRSAVLPALWILQRKEGILTSGGMAEVARALEIPPGPVEAVASFYSMFFFRPHGRYVVEMCTSMSCLLMGARPVLGRFEDELGVACGATTEDNFATLLEVECIGACGGAPAAQVNHRFFENLTPEKATDLVAGLREGTESLHEMPPGTEAAQRGGLVDLANPGANRVAVSTAGVAGSVVDLVKGHGLLLSKSQHPAERGYEEAPE